MGSRRLVSQQLMSAWSGCRREECRLLSGSRSSDITSAKRLVAALKHCVCIQSDDKGILIVDNKIKRIGEGAESVAG